jgi:hypothetical protein
MAFLEHRMGRRMQMPDFKSKGRGSTLLIGNLRKILLCSRSISEEFWQRKTAEWQIDEQQILMAMQGLREASSDVLLNANKALELANKAYFIYVTQSPAEQAQLLKIGGFELPAVAKTIGIAYGSPILS